MFGQKYVAVFCQYYVVIFDKRYVVVVINILPQSFIIDNTFVIFNIKKHIIPQRKGQPDMSPPVVVKHKT